MATRSLPGADTQKRGPTRFGRYTLIKRIALGGMAELFLAKLEGEMGFHKTLCLKRILPQFHNDTDFATMFRNEALVAARIHHPNVVQVHDFGEEDGQLYIAMEYVDGSDLRQVTKRMRKAGGQFRAAEVAKIGEEIASGLSVAHQLADGEESLGIVHRDVSPHNILVSTHGEAKLTDFGVAKVRAYAAQTKHGVLKGKVAYMSPEQARGEPVDARTDQYALGLVLWELLAGRQYFDESSELDLLRAAAEPAVTSLMSIAPSVPEALDEIIMKMLRPKPEERYASLEDVARALSQFRYRLGVAGDITLSRLLDERVGEGAGQTSTEKLSPAEAATKPWVEGSRAEATPTPAGRPNTATFITRPRTARWVALFAGVVLLGAGLWLGGRRATDGGQVRRTEVGKSVAIPQPATPPDSKKENDNVRVLPIVMLTSQPAGARIAVAGNDTGLRTPTKAALEPGSTIVFQKEGFHRQRKIFDGKGDRIEVMLRRKTAPRATASPPKKDPVRLKKGDAASWLTRSETGPRMGFLSLRTAGGWAYVRMGDKDYGTTPLERLALPVGRHRLELTNPHLGWREIVDIEIAEDADVRRTVHLR